MKRARKVLIISYIFPPTGGAGVQRTVKFIKYLRKYGYEPSVLTVEKGSVPLSDDSLQKDIPEGITVLKAKTLEPSYNVKEFVLEKKGKSWKKYLEKAARSVLVPDPQVLWLPGLFKKLLSLRKDRPDLIFVTAPPFSSLVAGVLAKYILGRPLVSDFRDEWVGFLAGSSWSDAGKGKRLSFIVEKLMERMVVRKSDAVITASPGYVDSFERKYGVQCRKKVVCITNGYDPADLRFEPGKEPPKGVLSAGKMNVIYMGTVWHSTSLKYFLEGLRKTEFKDSINLVVLGRVTHEEEAILGSYGDLAITKTGYFSHENAVRLASSGDALLVTLSPIAGAERIIPGKVFEYMAMRKHILAVIPEGATSRILNEYSGSIMAAPEDAGKIAAGIRELFLKWSSRANMNIDEDVSRHTRETKAKELCSIFDRILAGGHGSASSSPVPSRNGLG